jgi:DNA mismatch endonuclease (patch repair protein)
MSDVFTKRKRSEVMSRIRGRGNKDTELALAKLLRSHGITGWRRQMVVSLSVERSALSVGRSGVSVRPDFVFPRQRVAVFVDGCFWHGCPLHSPPTRWLHKSSMPTTTRSFDDPSFHSGIRLTRMTTGGKRTGKLFWRQKLAANKARDLVVSKTLRQMGWRVVRIWEHELTKNPQRCVVRIRQTLRLCLR